MNNWVALVRVNPKAGWCAYGPMSHIECLAFKRRLVGTAIECQPALLIKEPEKTVPKNSEPKA